MNKAFVREPDDVEPRCPKCGTPGEKVSRETILAQLQPAAMDVLGVFFGNHPFHRGGDKDCARRRQQFVRVNFFRSGVTFDRLLRVRRHVGAQCGDVDAVAVANGAVAVADGDDFCADFD